MRYKKLTLENFRTFEGNHEFNFPASNKLIVIHAVNGTGKSGMLHALNFVLYGRAKNPKSLNDENFTFNQLLSIPAFREGKYFFSVSLIFEHEGVDYEINRRVQLKDGVSIKNPTGDEYYKEILHVKKGDEVLSAITSQPTIEKLMSETVSRFFLVNREEIQNLDTALLDERENELIKQEIEKSIGVEVLEKGRDILTNIATDFTKAAAKDTDNSKKAKDAQGEFEGNVERIEKTKSNIKDQKNKLDETQKKIDKLEIELGKMASIEEETAKKQSLTEQVNGFEIDKILKTNQIRKYMIDNWFLPISDIALEAYDEAKRNQEDAEKIKNKIGNFDSDIKRLKSEIKTEQCSSCGQDIASSHVAKVEKKLKSILAQKVLLEDEYVEPNTIFPSTQVVQPYLEPSLDTLEEMERQLAKLELDILTTRNSIKKIDKGFDESLIPKVLNTRKELRQLEEVRTLAKNELSEEEMKLSNFNNMLKKSEKDIEKYTSDTKTSSKKSQLAKGIRDLYEDAFEKFRDKSRGDVSKLAKSVFVNLINNKGYLIELEEDYSISLVDENGDNAGTPSAGQSGVIAISLIAALARNSVTNAPIVMDSPMASLDNDHKKNVWSFIHELADQVILFVFPGEYEEKDHRKIIDKNLSAEYTLQELGVYNAKIVPGYKPNLLESRK